MPVVINFSLGEDQCPHDGRTELESWLAHEFRNQASAGKIFVAAAGNESAQRRHAVLDFTAPNQEITVPFEVIDKRTTLQLLGFCPGTGSHPDPGRLYIEFYYPVGTPVLTFSLIPVKAAGIPGPALSSQSTNHNFKGRNIMLSHSIARDVQADQSIVERNKITIQIDPSKMQQHVNGKYQVTLKATGPVQVHVWSGPVDVEVADLEIKLSGTLPAGVKQVDKNQICQPAGAGNTVAVANYNPADLLVYETSSRGPLVRYSGATPPAKPDVGAPGVDIQAAFSRDSTFIPASRQDRTVSIPLPGTSASAPHVAGTVALMLEKHKTLTPSAAIAKLKAFAVQLNPAQPDELGGGRLDAEKTVANTP